MQRLLCMGRSSHAWRQPAVQLSRLSGRCRPASLACSILGLGLATDVKGNWREVGPLHKLTFTKSHKSYRMAAEEHAVLTQHRGTLAALWHDCLLHLLPMPVGAEAPGPAPAPAAPASPGKPPPCKKAALAAA